MKEVENYSDCEGNISVKANLVNYQEMEVIQESATKKSKFKPTRRYPWHVFKSHESSMSQVSLNYTFLANQSAKKIETLLNNNKCLAKALEDCKYELAKKDNEENLDIISMAGLKIKDLSDNLKKISGCMDELVAVFQSHKQTKDAKNYLYATANRRDFKKKLQSLAGIEKLLERSLENSTDFTHEQNLKNNKENKKILAKNIQGKTTPQASFKQKTTKSCLKRIILKIPKSVSQRNNRTLDDSNPSYLLNLSSDLDSFKSKIEGKDVGHKGSKIKKPKIKSKREVLMQHSTNVIGKSKQETGSCKRSMPIQNSINKKNTKDGGKELKFSSHKKAKMVFALQDVSTISQPSSDCAMTSSSGNSHKNNYSSTSFSTDQSFKRSMPIQNSINKKNSKDSNKVTKFASHKKAEMVFALQDVSTISQFSSDGAVTSSGGNSCENDYSTTSFSTDQSFKRSVPILNSINKKNTKDNGKVTKFSSHKKAKMVFALQDVSTISQASSDGALTSSGGNSCENDSSTTSFSTEMKMDIVASGLQSETEISNLNGAFNTVQPIEDCIATHIVHTDGTYTNLEAEILLRQPRVVLRRSDLPQSFLKQESVPLNGIIDGCEVLSKKCDISEANSSVVSKKKVQFLLEEDDIEILRATSEPLRKVTVGKTKKRPLRDNYQILDPVPKKQALFTSREELQSNDKIKNTFIVTAEVHKPPDDYIPEKTPSLKNIKQLNMQPRVVLTDIYKCNSQNVMLGNSHQSCIVQNESEIVHKELATTDIVDKDLSSLHSEDPPRNHDLLAMSDKENKIGHQNFLGERKQSRRVSSKVSSYKEMKLNVKLRRC